MTTEFVEKPTFVRNGISHVACIVIGITIEEFENGCLDSIDEEEKRLFKEEGWIEREGYEFEKIGGLGGDYLFGVEYHFAFEDHKPKVFGISEDTLQEIEDIKDLFENNFVVRPRLMLFCYACYAS